MVCWVLDRTLFERGGSVVAYTSQESGRREIPNTGALVPGKELFKIRILLQQMELVK
jgi:hypothetical protein